MVTTHIIRKVKGSDGSSIKKLQKDLEFLGKGTGENWDPGAPWRCKPYGWELSAQKKSKEHFLEGLVPDSMLKKMFVASRTWLLFQKEVNQAISESSPSPTHKGLAGRKRS